MCSIAERLAALDGKTRSELLSQSEISSDTFTIYADDVGFARDARRRLAQREFDDSTRIARIRLGSKKRLYAIEAPDGVFNLLWWDPEHSVYPTEPRNT